MAMTEGPQPRMQHTQVFPLSLVVARGRYDTFLGLQYVLMYSSAEQLLINTHVGRAICYPLAQFINHTWGSLRGLHIQSTTN